MKKILACLTLALLAACATTPAPKPVAPPVVAAPTFHVDLYEVIALEYASPTQIAGVSPFGPTDKEESCERAAAATVAQGDQLPGGHKYAATCLHIAMSGPALGGQVVVQPFAGKPLGYIAIAVGVDRVGNLMGVKPLRGLPDAATCRTFGELVRKGVMQEHGMPAGASLIIYCLGVPVFAAPSDSDVLYTKPCPGYPFPGAGPCEIATLLRVGERR